MIDWVKVMEAGGIKRQFYQAFVACLLVACLGGLACAEPAYADECPAGGSHAYSVTILVPATEDAEGLKSFVCTRCGYAFEKVVPATGHSWGPWIVDLAPTCMLEGHEYRVCGQYTNNQHTEDRIIPMLSPTGAHVYAVVEEVPATCEAAGFRQQVCEYCGAVNREEVPALGHAWGDWVEETPATTTAAGQRVRRCAHDASHVETEVIPIVDEVQEPVEKPAAPDEPTAQPQVEEPAAPEKHEFFSFKPTAFDAAFLGLDLLVVALVAFFIIPFLARLAWAKRRTNQAFEQYLEKAKEETP